MTAFSRGFAATATLCGVTEGCAGGGEVYATSVDGKTWVRQPQPVNPECCVMQSITAGGPGLVAVGLDYSAGFPAVPGDAAVGLSADGATWTHVLGLPSLKTATMGYVIAGGPGFIASGYGHGAPQIWISPDATQWERVSSDDTTGGGQIKSLAQTGSRIVAVGVGSQGSTGVWTSDAAARTWLPGASLGAGALDAAVVSGSLFVVGGEDDIGAAVWTSDDGSRWNQTMTEPAAEAPGAVVLVLATHEGDIVAFGTDAAGGVVNWVGHVIGPR